MTHGAEGSPRRVASLQGTPRVSVVMPVLNEEAALPFCIRKIQETFREHDIDGEIVVCDNGSTDRSVEIAESMGARVVHQPLRGYGSAYLMGFAAARGEHLIMGDADDTYDFRLIPKFLDALDEGCDFVTGSRFMKGAEVHDNPWVHRFIGNPALTRLLNLLFGTNYSDVYCGFRGFRREVYQRIRPVSTGMEFNLEIAANAALAGLRIKEIPIVLHPRKGDSKLKTVRDGWRSLRMMLLYSPNALFLWPGGTLIVLGGLLHGAVLLQLLSYDGRKLSVITSLFALVATVTGFQILSLGLHAKTFSWSRRFQSENSWLKRFYEDFKLEHGLLLGFSLSLGSGAYLVWVVARWLLGDLQPLEHPERVVFAATMLILGLGSIFSSAFISAMSIERAVEGNEPS
jgi:glycosyltransferase involved in cell wall biosynthesis